MNLSRVVACTAFAFFDLIFVLSQVNISLYLYVYFSSPFLELLEIRKRYADLCVRALERLDIKIVVNGLFNVMTSNMALVFIQFARGMLPIRVEISQKYFQRLF